MSGNRVPEMRHATVNGTELGYREEGTGEPIVLVHGGLIADVFAPLIERLVADGRYRVVSYHRRGFGASARATGTVTVGEQAADCLALMRYLGIERAHVAGYSLGGSIALQLALDAPGAVHSLAVLEPLIPAALTDPATVQFFLDTAGAAIAKYAASDEAGAIDTFARGAFGADYRPLLEAALPGGFAQMVADADALFQVEPPATQQWVFAQEQAARIACPALAVYHDDPVWGGFRQTQEALRSWLPSVQSLTLPATTHLLQLVTPREAAAGLTAFFAAHALYVPA